MKTLIPLCFCLGLSLATSTFAARGPAPVSQECQYTVLQNIIRDARSHEKVFELIRAGVSMDDKTITCGGTIMQLAIRRGNISILNGILTQDPKRVRAISPLYDLSIDKAPNKIPVILFAAYYAPSEAVFKVLLDNKADVSVRDSFGHDILWYLDQNPVLRQTTTEDKVKQLLQQKLFDSAKLTQAADPKAAPAPEEEIDLKGDTLTQP